MKLFTVSEGWVVPGWTIDRAAVEPGVVLGEEGRGRTLRLIRLTPAPVRGPCPNRGTGVSGFMCPLCRCPRTRMQPHPDQGDAWLGLPDSPLLEGSLAERLGLLYLGPAGDSPATRAGVIVRDHSGYRGGWSLLGPRLSSCPREGQPIPAGLCPGGCGLEAGGWDSPVGTPHPERGVYGPAPRPLLEGYCAQGDAGHMGGGAELLFIMDPGQGFAISPYGRRTVGLRLVSWDGASLLARTPDEARAEEGRETVPTQSW